jgi:hypothetical protein
MADGNYEQTADVVPAQGPGAAEAGPEQETALKLLMATHVLRELADKTLASIEKGEQPPAGLGDLLKVTDPAAIPGRLNELAGAVFKQIEVGDLPENY